MKDNRFIVHIRLHFIYEAIPNPNFLQTLFFLENARLHQNILSEMFIKITYSYSKV